MKITDQIFKKIFTKDVPLDKVMVKIWKSSGYWSTSMNFLKEFSINKCKIVQALGMLNIYKSPGPDGGGGYIREFHMNRISI